jgi:hypothetical protein
MMELIVCLEKSFISDSVKLNNILDIYSSVTD